MEVLDEAEAAFKDRSNHRTSAHRGNNVIDLNG